MRKDATYEVSEWEWLSMNLRLYSIESRGTSWHVHYHLRGIDPEIYFSRTDAEIVCNIYCAAVEDLFAESKEEVEEILTGWARGEKKRLASFISRLPATGGEIDLERDFLVEVMQDYGMGASVLCEIVGHSLKWTAVGEGLFVECSGRTSDADEAPPELVPLTRTRRRGLTSSRSGERQRGEE